MVDRDTFLTTLYVMIDDFCQSQGFDEKHRPGPAAALSCSEVVTLAMFGQWAQFPSERAYTCAGYLGDLFEKARDCARKICLSHCHDEERVALARNIENR
jgi:hypothetical protein